MGAPLPSVRFSRRVLLAGVVSALAAGVAGAHTPYKQWDVYRRKHLLIGTCRADPESYPLGKRLVAAIAASLPESKARVTRAPDQKRLASLLTTGQLQLVLLTFDEAGRLARGDAPFEDLGPFALNVLYSAGEHALVCGEDFPDRHAWLVAKALNGQSPAPSEARLPLHAGAKAFLDGREMPD